MSTSGVLLGAAGALQEIEHGGRVYRVGRLTEGAKDAFSAWMIGRARRVIVSLYGGTDELKDRLDALAREALEGAYDFHDEVCLGRDGRGGILHTRGGMLALAAILLGCTQDEAIAIMSAKKEELQHLLELSIAESLPGVKIGVGPGGEARTQGGEQGQGQGQAGQAEGNA